MILKPSKITVCKVFETSKIENPIPVSVQRYVAVGNNTRARMRLPPLYVVEDSFSHFYVVTGYVYLCRRIK